MTDVNITVALQGVQAVQASLNNLKGELNNLGTSTASGTGGVGALERAFASLASGVGTAFNAIFSLKGVLVAAGLEEFARHVLDAASEVDDLEAKFRAVTGSTQAAKDEFAFARDEANRLGIGIFAAATALGNMELAAKGTALEGEGARKIFVAISEASASLGQSASETSNALGVFQSFMGRAELGGRQLEITLNQALPGAFKQAALAAGFMDDATGLATDKFKAFLDTGTVVTSSFLPELARRLQETANEGGQLAFAIAGPGESLQRFKNAILDFQISIGSSGLVDVLLEGLNKFSELLNNPAFLAGVSAAAMAVGGLISTFVVGPILAVTEALGRYKLEIDKTNLADATTQEILTGLLGARTAHDILVKQNTSSLKDNNTALDEQFRILGEIQRQIDATRDEIEHYGHVYDGVTAQVARGSMTQEQANGVIKNAVDRVVELEGTLEILKQQYHDATGIVFNHTAAVEENTQAEEKSNKAIGMSSSLWRIWLDDITDVIEKEIDRTNKGAAWIRTLQTITGQEHQHTVAMTAQTDVARIMAVTQDIENKVRTKALELGTDLTAMTKEEKEALDEYRSALYASASAAADAAAKNDDLAISGTGVTVEITKATDSFVLFQAGIVKAFGSNKNTIEEFGGLVGSVFATFRDATAGYLSGNGQAFSQWLDKIKNQLLGLLSNDILTGIFKLFSMMNGGASSGIGGIVNQIGGAFTNANPGIFTGGSGGGSGILGGASSLLGGGGSIFSTLFGGSGAAATGTGMGAAGASAGATTSMTGLMGGGGGSTTLAGGSAGSDVLGGFAGGMAIPLIGAAALYALTKYGDDKQSSSPKTLAQWARVQAAIKSNIAAGLDPLTGIQTFNQTFDGGTAGGSYSGKAIRLETGQQDVPYNWMPIEPYLHEIKAPGYAMGGDFIVNRPQLIRVGESGTEHVRVSQMNGGRGSGSDGSVSINISGPAVFDALSAHKFGRMIQQTLTRRQGLGFA